eukprot:TRINITY_DN23022_c0_g1_i2.p1 TRINITY_DN23022_c0_g1~~TRINITY_DN23022_c0_g1_i2.p1  ORF type:complete len:765 (-),score=279.62 TRINITY_DN23022_c0_g1_i2:166-2460(-)
MDYVTEKRDWAEKRLEEETRECQVMRKKVAATVEMMAQQRRDHEAEKASLNKEIIEQRAVIDNQKLLHNQHKREWEKALATAASLTKERDATIVELQERMDEMERAHRAACASQAAEVAALHEGVRGHIADKEYLDKMLAEVRAQLEAEKQSHADTRAEMARVKREAANEMEKLQSEMAHLKLSHETKIKMLEDRFRQTFEASEKHHKEETIMTRDEHDNKCKMYEEQITKCEALTQEKIAELAALRQEAELAAAAAAQKLELVQTSLEDAREQIKRLTADLDAQRLAAKEMEVEYKEMVTKLGEALTEAGETSKRLRCELDKMSDTLAAERERNQQAEAALQEDLVIAKAEFNQLQAAKDAIELDLNTQIANLTIINVNLEQMTQDLTAQLEDKTRQLLQKTTECSQLESRCEAIDKEGRRRLAAAHAQHEKHVSVVQAEHAKVVDNMSQAATMLKKELRQTMDDLRQLELSLAESRAQTQEVEARLMKEVQAHEADRVAWDENKKQLEYQVSEYQLETRRAEQQLQRTKSDLLEKRQELEDVEKDNERLRAERDSIKSLCEETHNKKEEYKERLLVVTQDQKKLMHELEFALKDGHALRTTITELEMRLSQALKFKQGSESKLQTQLDQVCNELADKEIERDQLTKQLAVLSDKFKTVRMELGTVMKENHFLRLERQEIACKIPSLEQQVASVQHDQHVLLDQHIPLSTTHKHRSGHVLAGNSGALSLRELPGLVSGDAQSAEALRARKDALLKFVSESAAC